ncbi:MAG: flagellar biosynthetic protein FliO, partial [Chitinivibrionales bacterium]|nr:flagellar biosynthetic protein FliO [Chitinivibrionales bacterium]
KTGCTLRMLLASLSLMTIVSMAIAQKTAFDSASIDIEKIQQALAGVGGQTSLDTTTAVSEVSTGVKELRGRYIGVTIKIIFYLIILIAVSLGIVWLLRRGGLSSTAIRSSASLDLLENLTVGQNRSIMLVRVIDTVLVVSQAPQGIALLDKIEGQKALEIIATAKSGSGVKQFKDVFNTFVDSLKKPKQFGEKS